MNRSKEYKFMQQQGFEVGDEESTKRHFKSLLFQPTIVGSLILLAVLFQIAPLFLGIGVVLWFNALFPQANPFERLYDATIGKINNYPVLPPAPPPRRFMQGMAGTLMLLASFFIYQNLRVPAYITQGFIVIAFSLLLFGKFCVGAYLYHIFTGKSSFANSTCPWSE
jgi:hypothetical protein